MKGWNFSIFLKNDNLTVDFISLLLILSLFLPGIQTDALLSRRPTSQVFATSMQVYYLSKVKESSRMKRSDRAHSLWNVMVGTGCPYSLCQ